MKRDKVKWKVNIQYFFSFHLLHLLTKIYEERIEEFNIKSVKKPKKFPKTKMHFALQQQSDVLATSLRATYYSRETS